MRWKRKLNELASIKMTPNAMSRIMFITLGCVLIFSSIGKIVKPPDMENLWFAGMLGRDITNVLITALPYCEFVVGVLLVLRLKVKYVAWLAMGLFTLFLSNNAWLIADGRGAQFCGQCLGWGIDTWAVGSLWIDMVMMGVLLGGVWYYRRWEAE